MNLMGLPSCLLCSADVKRPEGGQLFVLDVQRVELSPSVPGAPFSMQELAVGPQLRFVLCDECSMRSVPVAHLVETQLDRAAAEQASPGGDSAGRREGVQL